MKFQLPNSTKNMLSLIGATIALVSLFMIVFLFVLTTFFERSPIYMGVIIYMLLPAVMIIGLILIPVGMWKSRTVKSGSDTYWPFVDLNDPKHRNALTIFIVGTAVFFLLSAVGSYEAFHYTESVEFCGTMCHEVMQPEYTAYQSSAHARVACAECHIGGGAGWFVKSKLSGLYQVYAVIADIVPHPIETPIANLRPARETCEQCHWPQKFYARKQRVERHYLNDEENTEWDIYLNMKLGPAHSALGFEEGIHWHINPNVKIEYKTTDKKLQDIPWVKFTNLKTGTETIYSDEENPLKEEDAEKTILKQMDCMDCHNRPSHSYKPPAFFVNEAITAGRIPRELPEIKSLTMQICAEEFTTSDSADMYIEKTIKTFYEEDYPEIVEDQPELIEQAIAGFKEVFHVNIFPEMKVRWSAYPNHIGHLEFDGCFRCHDDQHSSEDGKVISRDCNLCHTITGQGNPLDMQFTSINKTLEFKHPSDIDEEWKEELCTECHTGLDP